MFNPQEWSAKLTITFVLKMFKLFQVFVVGSTLYIKHET